MCWEPTQGDFWVLQPFLQLGEGCPTVLVRSEQEKVGAQVPSLMAWQS